MTTSIEVKPTGHMRQRHVITVEVNCSLTELAELVLVMEEAIHADAVLVDTRGVGNAVSDMLLGKTSAPLFNAHPSGRSHAEALEDIKSGRFFASRNR